MLCYFGEQISPHMIDTPEGFLICKDVPISRTGEMQYAARELQLDGDPERLVTVVRDEADVFSPAAMASFEGKPITDGHPPDNLTPESVAGYAKGHVQNVRRSGSQTIADLHVTDPNLISDVKNGLKREISCGYTARYELAGDGRYKQTNIQGNHVAVVPQGRAGHEVAIKDAAPAAKVERRPIMRDKKQGLFAMFGRAAKDASQEELDQMVQDAASMLESEPAKAQEPAPVEPKPATDATPAGGGSDDKLDKLIELVTALCAQKSAPTDDSPEAQIDKTISGLEKKPAPEDVKDEPAAPEDEPGAKVISADADEQGTLMGDAAVQILKNARPAIAAMKDPDEKKAVTDALLKSIRASVETPGADLLKATADAAKQHLQETDPEARSKAQQAAYNARNPHRQKEDK
ncbi:DUF2213 domain-containing protein [Oscillibacter sp.]|uniref:DUF2213 domain-containing protein n=1 Tax=Oscillibacter sp. TaxID=1945593 RepID=UPI0028986ABD|nr:DUF2213 domain-containing protein [Oscillibacter sp.]